MFIVSVCQEMKWDYHTYMSQPVWFLELLAKKITLDSERVKQAMLKEHRKKRLCR